MGPVQAKEVAMGWRTKSNGRPLFNVPGIMEHDIIRRLSNGLDGTFDYLVRLNIDLAEGKLLEAQVFQKASDGLFHELGPELWPDTDVCSPWLDPENGTYKYTSVVDRKWLRQHFREWVVKKVSNKRRSIESLKRADDRDEDDYTDLTASAPAGAPDEEPITPFAGTDAVDPDLHATSPTECPDTVASGCHGTQRIAPIADMGVKRPLPDESLDDIGTGPSSRNPPQHSPSRRQLDAELPFSAYSSQRRKRAANGYTDHHTGKRARRSSQPPQGHDNAPDSPLSDMSDVIRCREWRPTSSGEPLNADGADTRESTAAIVEVMANLLQDQVTAKAYADPSTERSKTLPDSAVPTEQGRHMARSTSHTIEPEARATDEVEVTKPQAEPATGKQIPKTTNAGAPTAETGSAAGVNGHDKAEQPAPVHMALKAFFDAKWEDFCSLKARMQDLEELRNVALESFKFNEAKCDTVSQRRNELRSLLEAEEAKYEACVERLEDARKRMDEAKEKLLIAGETEKKFCVALQEACNAFSQLPGPP